MNGGINMDFNEFLRELIANIDFWLYDVTLFFHNLFNGLL